MLEDTLIQLLSIPSFTQKEKAISLFIEEKNQQLKNFELCKKENSLCYFSKPYSEKKKTLAFYGHLDTVKNQQTLPIQKKDGFIYGCGASDMKGGVAVMMELMKWLDRQSSEDYNYQFIFYTGEEGNYHQSGLEGIFDFDSRLKKIEIAFILEPTNNHIQIGCLGSIKAKLKIIGKSGHSARPWLAENAIHKSWEFLRFLSEKKPIKVSLQSLNFYEVFSVTMIKGGVLANVIPGEVEFLLNYRYAPNKNKKQAEEFFYQYFNEKVDEVVILENAPAGKVVAENHLLKKIKEKFSLEIQPKQAWTDIARLGEEGIAAINLGPGDPSEAHQKNEKINIQNLYQNVSIYQYITMS